MTNINSTIRQANENDYQAVDLLYQQNYQLYGKNIPSDYKIPPTPTLPKGTFLNILDDKKAVILVAEVNVEVVGMLHAIIEKDEGDEWTQPYRRVSIEEMSVAPEFSRQGIGSKLIKAVEKWAKQKKISDITALVHNFNKNAISFYEKNKFVPYSVKLTKKIKVE